MAMEHHESLSDLYVCHIKLALNQTPSARASPNLGPGCYGVEMTSGKYNKEKKKEIKIKSICWCLDASHPKC